jgi:hypothetical protein
MTPETNGAAAAKVRAAIPACAFKGMSATIFLRRLWKIPQLTTSFRQPIINVNNFWDTQATIFGTNPATRALHSALGLKPWDPSVMSVAADDELLP